LLLALAGAVPAPQAVAAEGPTEVAAAEVAAALRQLRLELGDGLQSSGAIAIGVGGPAFCPAGRTDIAAVSGSTLISNSRSAAVGVRQRRDDRLPTLEDRLLAEPRSIPRWTRFHEVGAIP
jgi:hypothetical protein